MVATPIQATEQTSMSDQGEKQPARRRRIRGKRIAPGTLIVGFLVLAVLGLLTFGTVRLLIAYPTLGQDMTAATTAAPRHQP